MPVRADGSPGIAPVRLWEALVQIDTVAVLHVGLDGRVRNASAGVDRLLGVGGADLLGEALEVILPEPLRGPHAGFFADYVRRQKNGDVGKSPIVRRTRHFPMDVTIGGETLRFVAQHRSGREVPVSLTVNEIRTRRGELEGFVGLLVDSSEEHALQERMRRQSLRDELTDLLNWRGLQEAVIELERKSLGNDDVGRFSLLHIEVDHFSWLVLESRAVADGAVRRIARWLQQRVAEMAHPNTALVARHFSATAFLVYLADCQAVEVGRLAESLRQEFSALNLGTEIIPFHTTLSIGTVMPEAGTTLDFAVSRAATACHDAHSRGHDRVVAAQQGEMRLHELGRVIRQALKYDRLDVLAQCMIPLGTTPTGADRRPVSFEILSRLRDPRGATLSPGLVFPAAEQLGLSVDLDLHVIHRVMATLAANRSGLEALHRCSINLSGVSLSSLRLLEGIRELIEEYDIPACRLCFEITESSQVPDRDVALANVQALRSLGCRIAIDDFGSGYSNYQSLAQWPVDIVKVDGAYVRELLEGGPLAVDLEGIIASAKARGLEVVAEFVETEEVAESLRKLGVEYGQGFLFHCPEPLERLLERPRRIHSGRRA